MVNMPLSNQSRDVDPPWMQGAKDISGQEMLVVHMSSGELEGLDNLQRGPSIDPDTGIREYSALSTIIDIPEVREIFKHVADELRENGKLSPDLHKIYESAREHSLPYKPTPEEMHDPFIKNAEKTGRDGDDKLALIPLNFALFLIELKHKPSINPKTGLLEFGLFHELIRAVGTIAGAVVGGPLGAGAGRAIAGAITGQKPGHALVAGVKTGALTYAGQGLGQAAGLMGGAPNLLAQGLGSMGIGSVPAIGSAAGQLGQAGLGVGKMSGIGSSAAPALAQQAASPGWMGTIGNFMSKAAPFAPIAVAGLSYMGSKQHHKNLNRHQQEEKQMMDQERERMGYNYSLPPINPNTRRYNPRFSERTDLERKYGVFSEPAFIEEGEGRYAKGGLVKSYNKGTLVTGKGKGQDDTIKTSVPDRSYIIDASSTSDLGDGSTKAGSEVLKQFENRIKSKFPNKFLKKVEKEVSRTSTQVPVWLSDSEYKFDPVTVTLLGGGSNVKGASMLKNMVVNLRKHKISKGHGLPPKAKHPMQYISISR